MQFKVIYGVNKKQQKKEVKYVILWNVILTKSKTAYNMKNILFTLIGPAPSSSESLNWMHTAMFLAYRRRFLLSMITNI